MPNSHESVLACVNPKCGATIPWNTVLFECMQFAEGKNWSCEHPHPDQPASLGKRTIFLPNRKSPDDDAICPHCGTSSSIMRCPEKGCFALIPYGTDQVETIAVVGARTSGKTFFITGLLRQIKNQLGRDDSLNMSLEFMGDAGREYFDDLHEAIYEKHELAAPTMKGVPLSIYSTIRFPVRQRMKRLWKGEQADIPLVFPDPSGELFEKMNNVAFLTYLKNAKGLIFLVDPLAERKYRQDIQNSGKRAPTYKTQYAHQALGTLVNALRGFMRKPSGKLDKSLAVVVTKCDEPLVFDPDQSSDTPPQGREYQAGLAKVVSKRVESYMRDGLDLPGVGALARTSFKRVAFFAASALGAPPNQGKLIAPEPRRVEEPLLWILHQWGYL